MFCDENLPSEWFFTDVDRLLFAGLYHLATGVLRAMKEAVIRWHPAGFWAYWRRRSGRRKGRPQTPLEIRRLIRDVSLANPLWGAPRIHGELLKLGLEIGQTTVAKYMAKRSPPWQGWRTFISNHAEGIAALDLFVVPTLSFPLCPLFTQSGRCAGRLNTRPAFRPHRKTCTRERSHVGVLEARTSSPWVGVRLI
jgi:hypothetical protein